MRRVAGGAARTIGLLALAVSPLLAFWNGGAALSFPVRLTVGLPHAAAYLFFLWLFGRTLAAGRDPLITAVARRVHGTLKPEIEAYTRNVTLAWCLFCCAQLAASVLLFAFAPVDAWLLFVGLLNFPLLAFMFLGEYCYRLVRYPDHPRTSMVRSGRAFVEGAFVSAGAKPR
jgi:uncharacterized membrane protein